MFGKRTSLTYMPSPVMNRLDLSGLMQRPMNPVEGSAIEVCLFPAWYHGWGDSCVCASIPLPRAGAGRGRVRQHAKPRQDCILFFVLFVGLVVVYSGSLRRTAMSLGFPISCPSVGNGSAPAQPCAVISSMTASGPLYFSSKKLVVAVSGRPK